MSLDAPLMTHVSSLLFVVQVVFDVRTSMGPSDKISVFRKGSREPVRTPDQPLYHACVFPTALHR